MLGLLHNNHLMRHGRPVSWRVRKRNQVSRKTQFQKVQKMQQNFRRLSKIETAIPGMINFLHVSAADYQCLFLCGPQELLLHA